MDDLSAIATAAGVLVALAFGVWEGLTRWRARVRSQADRVAAWTFASPSPVGRAAVTINNGSDRPVYDLTAFLVFRSGAAPHSGGDWAKLDQLYKMASVVALVPPGEHTHRMTPPDNSPMGSAGVLMVEIAFTDQAGHHWLRSYDGRLRRLRQEPVEYYGIGRPTPYQPLGGLDRERGSY